MHRQPKEMHELWCDWWRWRSLASPTRRQSLTLQHPGLGPWGNLSSPVSVTLGLSQWTVVVARVGGPWRCTGFSDLTSGFQERGDVAQTGFWWLHSDGILERGEEEKRKLQLYDPLLKDSPNFFYLLTKSNLLNFSRPQFSHLKNEGHNCWYIVRNRANTL